MMRLPAFALAALCASAAFAGDPEPGSGKFAAELEPGKMHEVCMHLESGERRRYEWKSSASVDFNIHYHRGSEVAYPVKRDGTRSWRAGFAAKTTEDYCWMWTARTKPAKVEGWIGK